MRTSRTSVIVYIELSRLETATDEQMWKAVDHLEAAFTPASLVEMFEFSFHQMDDCIVWLLPLDSVENLRQPSGHLFHALLTVVHVQDEVLARGALLRGVVTVEQAFCKRRRLFGPGITRSRSLLAQCPPYPRVIFDPALDEAIRRVQVLRAAHHSVEQERGYIEKMLRQDTDGFWFIDYLRAIQWELDEPEKDYLQLLYAHREVIEAERSAEAYYPHRNRQALGWLAVYHNTVVREMASEHENELTVPVVPPVSRQYR